MSELVKMIGTYGISCVIIAYYLYKDMKTTNTTNELMLKLTSSLNDFSNCLDNLKTAIKELKEV